MNDQLNFKMVFRFLQHAFIILFELAPFLSAPSDVNLHILYLTSNYSYFMLNFSTLKFMPTLYATFLNSTNSLQIKQKTYIFFY